MDQTTTIKRNIAPLLYVLNKFEGKLNRHKLFKILYFADMDHIARYGRTITDDTYIAMKFGPVPSRLFDYVKAVAHENKMPVNEDFLAELETFFSTSDKYIMASVSPDLDFLSKSEIQSLDSSANKYGDKSFEELCQASHGSAWSSSNLNDEISVVEIAKEAGANSHMLQYIQEAI